jgi:hypothetical protein
VIKGDLTNPALTPEHSLNLAMSVFSQAFTLGIPKLSAQLEQHMVSKGLLSKDNCQTFLLEALRVSSISWLHPIVQKQKPPRILKETHLVRVLTVAFGNHTGATQEKS